MLSLRRETKIPNMIQPIKLGSLKLKNNVFLAPLAGISDSVYRQLAVKAGAGLVYTEMISAAGLSRRDRKTFRLMEFSKSEKPIVVQLFGNKPQEFTESVQVIEGETDFDLIDINMGCPVKKVIQSGSGSALMKDLSLAREIIQSVVSKASLPVSVKFRSGWNDQSINFLELGKICEAEGVTAVCLHPRTRAQAYLGHSNWDQIKELKSSLKIPVIGSGDIKQPQDAQAMLDQTKCDAVMIGRGSMGNPWLIRNIISGQETHPIIEERIAAFLDHVKLFMKSYDYKNEKKSLCEMRKFAHRYISGFSGSAKIRQEINRITEYQVLESFLKNQLYKTENIDV